LTDLKNGVDNCLRTFLIGPMPTRKRKPSPAQLLAEVKGKEPAKTYEFEDYLQVIHELVEKDYSYAKIAAFLAGKLGMEISRGQVYRAYQIWSDEQERSAEEARQAEEYLIQQAEDGPEPDVEDGPDDADKMNAFWDRAAADIRTYLKKKYAKECKDLGLPEEFVLRRALEPYEQARRDEAEAEEADRQKEAAKGETKS